MSTKCIICDSYCDTLSEEHIIPEAIGGGYKRHILCKDCNTEIGDKIDYPFTDSPNILYLRFRNQSLDKDNKLIEENDKRFKFRDNQGQPVILKRITEDMRADSRYCIDKDDKFYFYQSSNNFLEIKDHTAIISNAPDEETVIKKLGRSLTKNKIPYNSDNLAQKLQSINIKNSRHEVSFPVVRVDTYICVRELIKIAHEFSYDRLGSNYYNNKYASMYRDYLYAIIKSKAHDEDLEKLLKDYIELVYDDTGILESKDHNIMLRQGKDKIICQIILFNYIYCNIIVADADAYTDFTAVELRNDYTTKKYSIT